jgi:hypothetical protein
MSDEHGLSTQDDNMWMCVLTTYSLPEAHIVAGRLDYHDIPTIIQREAAGEALGIHIGALGEITVLVNPNDFERAMDILKDVIEIDGEDESDLEDEDATGLYDPDEPDLLDDDGE